MMMSADLGLGFQKGEALKIRGAKKRAVFRSYRVAQQNRPRIAGSLSDDAGADGLFTIATPKSLGQVSRGSSTSTRSLCFGFDESSGKSDYQSRPGICKGAIRKLG